MKHVVFAMTDICIGYSVSERAHVDPKPWFFHEGSEFRVLRTVNEIAFLHCLQYNLNATDPMSWDFLWAMETDISDSGPSAVKSLTALA